MGRCHGPQQANCIAMRNRKIAIPHDASIYRHRNQIER